MEPVEAEPEVAVSTPTADRLLMMFAAIAGGTLVLSVLLVALLALVRPESDTGEIIKALNTQISLILGAVLGYIARTGVERRTHVAE